MPRPKIAVLYLGGAIGMIRNQRTGLIEPLESMAEIHRFLPELQREAALDFFTLSNVLSSEIRPTNWVDLARTIQEKEDDYEGFVIVHGTSTMTYTAAALSFALQDLSKPVVFTGSLLPINDLASDGRLNLVHAVRAASLDIAEVCIALGPRVLRATRAQKVDHSILQTFDSPKFPALAEFGPSTQLSPLRTVRRKRRLSARIGFDERVLLLSLHPGAPLEVFDAVLATAPHAIVLRAYGLGLLPEELLPWVRRVLDADIPLVIVSQFLHGSIDLSYFRKQLALEKLGVISGHDMTTECALVKTMWALTQARTAARFQSLMESNLVGEITV
jgi:L-asparaginase